jgi:hypothetical protein
MRESETIELCSFAPCEHMPTWKLQQVEGNKVLLTCDNHLAEGIRTTGAPAKVEIHTPIRTDITMKIKHAIT